MTMTVAEIAVRLAAGYAATGNVGRGAIDAAEYLHAELVKRGHIKPDQPPAEDRYPIHPALAGAFERLLSAYVDLGPKPEPAHTGPDWSKAPDWANWAAMDNDGIWHWFADAYPTNWRESLQRRPEGV